MRRVVVVTTGRGVIDATFVNQEPGNNETFVSRSEVNYEYTRVSSLDRRETKLVE